MEHSGSPAAGALLASFAAGPIFTSSLMFAELYLRLPDPIVIGIADLKMFAMVNAFSLIFGFAISVLPNLLGAWLMTLVADIDEVAREPIVWAAVGCLLGAALTLPLDRTVQDASLTFALIFTSAVCATLCRSRVRWNAAAQG